MAFDIDFVVLWVDGSDPAWLEEKRKYDSTRDENNDVHRYRDWGLMKYWFRAVEANAPWVRKIHFVTWGHLPPFLNVDHPKLHIVRHEDYMPHEALPCFNSCALELNLHRIEGLAEHFVYFNDDIFLTRPVTPGSFFDLKTGLPREQFCELPLRFRNDLKTWSVHMARGVSLINKWFPKGEIPWKRYFRQYLSCANPFADNLRTLALRLLIPGYFSGFRVFHTYSSFRKSTFETIWSREPELLRRTTAARFRGWEDVNQYFPYMWQLASGEFSPGRINYYLASIRPDTVDAICQAIVRQQHDSVCLNDPSPDVDVEALAQRLDGTFATILPKACAFEKPV